MMDMASVGLRVDSRDVRTASGDLDRFARSGDGAGRSATAATGAIGGMSIKMAAAAAAAAALAAALAAGAMLNRFIDATVTAEAAQAQLGAAIASTGGAAGRTVAQLNEHAAALQKITNFGDETINAMQGVLLTFREIKGDQFDAATVAVLDMSQALGQDLQSAAQQVGKALNDPVKGMTALSRSGVTFTDVQMEMAKEMVAANDIIGAQAIILKELEANFGGSAEAARDVLGGALASLRNAFGDLFELSGPGTEALRLSIESLTAAVANPAFFAAVQSIGTALFAAAQMGINALAMLLPVITAVVENIDVIGYSAGIAAAVFAGPYVVAMGAAAIASFSLTGALAILKTALISTGIGALVVGAGYLVAMFGRLVKAAGGFGEALGILKDVALEVWERIGLGVDFVAESIAAMSASAQAFFIGAINKMAGAFIEFTWTVADGLNSLFGTSLQGASAVITQELRSAQVAAENLAAASTAAANAAKEGFSAPLESLQALRDEMAESETATEGATAEAEAMNAALEDIGGGTGGGSAGKAAAAIEELTTFAQGMGAALQDGTQSAVEMGREFGGSLLRGIGSVSDAFGDFVAGGFRDWKGFMGSIVDTLRQTLSQVVSMFARNKIIMPLFGITGGGAGAAVAGEAGAPAGGGILSALIPGGGGGGGILGGLLGSFGSNGGILGLGGLGGGTGLLGGLGNALSGGLANVFSVGANAAAAGTAGVATFASTLGAALPILGAVALAFSFFRKRVRELDGGIRVTTTGMDSLIETFRTTETRRFFGLSKKVRTSFSELDAAVAGPLEKVIQDIQMGVIGAAAALGVGAEVFDNFAASISVSTKGMDEAAANAAVTAALSGFADEFAAMIPGLAELTREGETASFTLSNMVAALQLVNPAFAMLGSVFGQFAMTLEGGALARNMVDTFGGFEAFAKITTDYYALAYSQAEQLAHANKALREAFASLGLVMPGTIAGVRALVEQMAATGQMERAAALMQITPAFAAVLNGQQSLDDAARAALDADLAAATSDLRATFEREMSDTRDSFAASIQGLQDELTGARDRLANSKAIADALSSALRDRIFPSVEAQRQSQDAAAGYLRSLLGLSQINDVDALNAALSAVADPSADTFSSLEDYRRDFMRTSAVIAQLDRTAGIQLSADEQAVSLLERQIEDMQAQSDAALDMLQQQLDGLLGLSDSILSLADAIEAFQAAAGVASGGGGGASGGGGGVSQTSGLTFGQDNSVLGQIYRDVLGREADREGFDFFQGLINSGTLSLAEVQAQIATSPEAMGTPGFALGGMHDGGWRVVGERGPELEYTGPSQIVSNNRSLFDTSEMVSELRNLRAEVAELKQVNISTARNTNKIALITEKHDNIGMPGTAPGEIVKTEVA